MRSLLYVHDLAVSPSPSHFSPWFKHLLRDSNKYFCYFIIKVFHKSISSPSFPFLFLASRFFPYFLQACFQGRSLCGNLLKSLSFYYPLISDTLFWGAEPCPGQMSSGSLFCCLHASLLRNPILECFSFLGDFSPSAAFTVFSLSLMVTNIAFCDFPYLAFNETFPF